MWGLGVSDLIVLYIAAAALGAASPTLLLIVQHFEPPLPRSFGQTVVVGLVALAVIGPLWLGLDWRNFPAGRSATTGPTAERPARERIEGYEAGGQGPDTDIDWD